MKKDKIYFFNCIVSGANCAMVHFGTLRVSATNYADALQCFYDTLSDQKMKCRCIVSVICENQLIK